MVKKNALNSFLNFKIINVLTIPKKPQKRNFLFSVRIFFKKYFIPLLYQELN